MSTRKRPEGLTASDKFRTGKAYSIHQAAQLARTTPATVRRWLLGYEAPGHRMAPVFGEKRRLQDKEALLVSFLELVEIVVVSRFRQGIGSTPVSLGTLREAHSYALELFGLSHPFASLKMRVEGGHLMHEFDLHNRKGPRLALDLHGQWALPWPVQDEMEHLDFDGGTRARDPFALRWFPRGRKVPIVVDPHVAAGRPTIYKRAVTVETLIQRHRRGEPIEDLASDYDVEIHLLEEVLRYAA